MSFAAALQRLRGLAQTGMPGQAKDDLNALLDHYDQMAARQKTGAIPRDQYDADLGRAQAKIRELERQVRALTEEKSIAKEVDREMSRVNGPRDPL